MKTVKVLLSSLGLAGLLFVGACKDDPVADMKEIKEKVCACEDKECVESAMKDAKKMGEKYKGKEKGDFSEEDMKKIQELSKEMMKCAMEIQTGGGGGSEE